MIVLRSIAFNVLFYGWTAFLCIVLLPGLLLPDRQKVRLAQVWIYPTIWLLRSVCGITHEVRGWENLPDEPFILAAKHQSAWETITWNVLFKPQPAYVLKKELLRFPLFGRYLQAMKMIAIDRKAGSQAVPDMVRQAKEVLATGRAVIVFPEGTRTAPGEKRKYRRGVAEIYKATGVPVVPVAINSGKHWGRNDYMKYPGTIVVELLPAIPPGLETREFMATLEEAIETACAKL